MDPISGLLDGPRAEEAFLLRIVLKPPWSMRIQDNAPLTLLAVTDGAAWVVPDDAEPVKVTPGDVALIRGTTHYLIADDPATEPQVIVHPGQICTTIGGHDLAEEMGLGLRTWGNTGGDPTHDESTDSGSSGDPAPGDHGVCRMLVGIYETQPEVGTRFVAALPQLAVIPAAEHRSPLVAILGDELTGDGPGQQVILNRLLDLLVVSMARIIFERTDQPTPGWFRAQTDPVIGPALAAINHDPSHPWTVEELASRGGMSRAAFAHRFKALVGESPIAFLTDWRVSVAADLLRSSDATVAAVASEVGYSTPYAFSSAFKRLRGLSPSAYRRQLAPTGTGG